MVDFSIPELASLAPEVALLVVFAFIASLGAQLLKQPFLAGSKWNTIITYAVCVVFGIGLAFLRGQLSMIDTVTFATIVQDTALVGLFSTFFYSMWLKGTSIFNSIFDIGINKE